MRTLKMEKTYYTAVPCYSEILWDKSFDGLSHVDSKALWISIHCKRQQQFYPLLFVLLSHTVTARQQCSPSSLLTNLFSFGWYCRHPVWSVRCGVPFCLEHNDSSHAKNTLEIRTRCSWSGLIRRRCNCSWEFCTLPYSLRAGRVR